MTCATFPDFESKSSPSVETTFSLRQERGIPLEGGWFVQIYGVKLRRKSLALGRAAAAASNPVAARNAADGAGRCSAGPRADE